MSSRGRNVTTTGYDLDEIEAQCVERVLLIKSGCAAAGSDGGVRLVDAMLSEFCRYLVSRHDLPRRKGGYSLTGDSNAGYRLEPAAGGGNV